MAHPVFSGGRSPTSAPLVISAADGQLEITYLAGIPMRANTTGSRPKLDRTMPASVRAKPRQRLGFRHVGNRHRARRHQHARTATGTYQGPSTSGNNPTLSDTDVATVTSEDLVIRKSSVGQVIQGTTVTTNLVVETGEYRDFTNLKVTDTLPDGLCPLSP